MRQRHKHATQHNISHNTLLGGINLMWANLIILHYKTKGSMMILFLSNQVNKAVTIKLVHLLVILLFHTQRQFYYFYSTFLKG